MLTKTQEDVLKFLLGNIGEKNTIRSIAQKLGKSYTLTYNNIALLEKMSMISKETLGNLKIIEINKRISSDILIEIELKRKNDFLKKNQWCSLLIKDVIDNSSNPFFILLIFGSYAKNKQNEKSDIDLLAIVKDKSEIKAMQESILREYTKIKKSLVIVDIQDFKDMISNPEKFNVGNEARKNHILLYGSEHYYNLINSKR